MSRVIASIDELISTLNHSQLPTLIVEGDDDFNVYRWIEKSMTDLKVDVLPCTGRNNLLKLYERKNEIKNPNILFLADRDLWIFSSIPEEYEGIIFTEGYSIENDIYMAARGKIEALIPDSLQELYLTALQEYTKWYCFEVSNYLAKKPYQLDFKVKKILDNKTKYLSPHFLTEREYIEVDDSFVEQVFSQFYLKLRGKSLLQLWEWFTEGKMKKDTLFEVIFIFNEDNEFSLNTIKNIRNEFKKDSSIKDSLIKV